MVGEQGRDFPNQLGFARQGDGKGVWSGGRHEAGLKPPVFGVQGKQGRPQFLDRLPAGDAVYPEHVAATVQGDGAFVGLQHLDSRLLHAV